MCANDVPLIAEVFETSVFSRKIDGLLSETDRDLLIWSLAQKPDQVRPIPNGGGIRKLRWRMEGRGKRGGIRIIYYWIVNPSKVFLLYAYAKNEQSDLTPEQLSALRKSVEMELKQ